MRGECYGRIGQKDWEKLNTRSKEIQDRGYWFEGTRQVRKGMTIACRGKIE